MVRVVLDPRTNPSYLQLDLYCRGARMHENCFVEQDGGRKVMRTRAGLGSGLEAILPGDIWTNIPVQEEFAQSSPYEVRRDERGYALWIEKERIAPIQLAPRPTWYEQKTTSGKAMTRVGTLQGTYLGIYPSKVCEYWIEDTRTNCKFCSIGLNLGVDDADEKSVQEVLEVVLAARRHSGITYVDFNAGHYEGDTYLDILEPYIRAVKQATNLLIGVQTPPHHDLARYDALKEMGVNRVSFCFEIYDPQRFQEICPGKHREYGLRRYLDAVAYCAELGRRKSSWTEPWVTNGEIIAGLESPESSIAAIDWITSVGAIPTVCVFRPVKGSDLAHVPPPKTEDIVPVYRRLYEACMEQGLPIGVAPNVHVSLVPLPEECRFLSPRRFPLQQLKLAALRTAFRGRFQRSVDRAIAAAVQAN
ncbi:MAG: radical SAM protein [Planctomycetes bacterium]|nr:radical SAM protein [Planctomycetota bacterium]